MINILVGWSGTKRVFRVNSTGSLSVRTTLERAALALYRLSDNPEFVGITIEYVLNLPDETQVEMEFHAEEITDEFEYVNDMILITGEVEIHYCNEYLVKPQAVREDEIAAYIIGYTEAQYEKGVLQVRGNPYYCISHPEAKNWAHIFLMDRQAILSNFIEKMVEKSVQSDLSLDEIESEEDV